LAGFATAQPVFSHKNAGSDLSPTFQQSLARQSRNFSFCNKQRHHRESRGTRFSLIDKRYFRSSV
jgi:hypothetical protein